MGTGPAASLIFDTAGNLYGTTQYGGDGDRNFGGGGTVFELTPNGSGWTEKKLHDFGISFGTGFMDGSDPASSLIFDAAGNLYGTTENGGSNCSFEAPACGTVFELMPNGSGGWREKKLYNFSGMPDGGTPVSGLIFDAARNLCGTTQYGGDSLCGGSGCGTVFEITP